MVFSGSPTAHFVKETRICILLYKKWDAFSGFFKSWQDEEALEIRKKNKFENTHKHCNMLTLLKWGQDGFNKDNDGECKGRKREKRFQQSQKYEANETCMGIRDSKKSLFPVQITQYGCELRSANEDRELSLGFIVRNDSKTFIQEEAGSFSPTCVKIT